MGAPGGRTPALPGQILAPVLCPPGAGLVERRGLERCGTRLLRGPSSPMETKFPGPRE